MGWEWRVFYAGNIEGSFLAHADDKLPLVEADSASSKSDSRFDVYVSVSEDTGIKVRGDLSSPEVEVKTRKERTSKGLEKWKKVTFSVSQIFYFELLIVNENDLVSGNYQPQRNWW